MDVLLQLIESLRWWVLGYALLPYAGLRWLYLNGPALRGYGFWMGMSHADICNHLTNGVDGAHWIRHADCCDALIERNTRAFAMTVFLACLVACVVGCILRNWIVHAIAVDVRRLIRHEPSRMDQ